MPRGKSTEPLADLAPINWGAIRPQYEAGIRPLRDIGREFGASEGAIRKRALTRGWTRDLKARIHARADELVRKAEVRRQSLTPLDAYTERQTVEANASAEVTVRLGHKGLFMRARGIAQALLSELESVVQEPELFAQAHDSLAACGFIGEDLAKRMAEVCNALPGRTKILRDLLEAIRTCVAMEREAYGMDSKDATDRPTVRIKDYTGKGSPEAPEKPAEQPEDED